MFAERHRLVLTSRVKALLKWTKLYIFPDARIQALPKGADQGLVCRIANSVMVLGKKDALVMLYLLSAGVDQTGFLDWRSLKLK